MPTLKELSDKIDVMQTALDEEQQQVTDLLAQKDAAATALQVVVTDLEAQVASGGTEADRQAVLDKINAVIADLQGTVT